MPQLEIATFFSQLFWLFICFGLLLSVSVGFFLPRVSRIQNKRWEKIEGVREQADHLKNQSQAIQNAFEKHLAQARQKAQDRLLQATKEFSHFQETRKIEISNRLKQEFREAEEKILQQMHYLIPQIDTIATSLSAEIVQKIFQDFTDPTFLPSTSDSVKFQKEEKS